jgi:hypothetical protein
VTDAQTDQPLAERAHVPGLRAFTPVFNAAEAHQRDTVTAQALGYASVALLIADMAMIIALTPDDSMCLDKVEVLGTPPKGEA